MSTKSLKERNLNPLIPAIMLAIYAVWETFAMLFDFANVSDLCMSPISVVLVAIISVLLFMKKRGIIFVIPFGLLVVTYILNIYYAATGTYYAYFPLPSDSADANTMLFEYFFNLFIIFIDFAICANIIMLLISNTRLFSSKGNKNLSKYAILVLVIVRILIFLLYHLPTSNLFYMPIDCAAYYLLTPFLFYIGLLLCGFWIAKPHKITTDNINAE